MILLEDRDMIYGIGESEEYEYDVEFDEETGYDELIIKKRF